MLAEVGDAGGVLLGNRVPHRVGDVDGAGPGVHHRLHHVGEEVEFGARRVLGREFHVFHVGQGPLHAVHRPLDDLVLGHLQLEFAVDRAGGQKHVDAAVRVGLQRLAGAVDVGVVAAGQPADGGADHFLGDRLHRLEIARAGDGETRLDDVDTQFLQGMGHLQLLGQVHAGAGGLLAIA